MTGYHFEEAFHVQRVLMTLTGIWPDKKYGTWYTLYGFFVSFILVEFFMMPSMATVFLQSTDVAHGAYILFSTVTIFTYGIKVVVLYKNKQLFFKIIEDLEQPLFKYYNKGDEVFMKNAIVNSNRVRKLIQFPCVVFIVAIAVFPILEVNSQRPLPYQMPLNFLELPFSLYVIVYVLQVISAGVCACNNGNIDTLACSFMALGTAQLQILEKHLIKSAYAAAATDQRLHKSEDMEKDLEEYGIRRDENVSKNLRNCVRHHIAITKFVEKLEGMLTYICLAQFLTSVIVICITGFSFIVVPATNFMFGASVSYFSAATVEISMYCIFGDELMLQSAKIGDACYMSEWNNCGPKVRKMLLLIMERAKRPLLLTAGKFSNLSRTSLVMLYKSSMSYFAVLRKLYSPEE